jgi:phospholipase/carboxylesterase
VIFPERSERSRDFLQANGYDVQWKNYPMEHSLHPIEVIDIGHFLRRVLRTND